MSKRHKMSKHSSGKLFTRTAGPRNVHPRNVFGGARGAGPMRGGIRL